MELLQEQIHTLYSGLSRSCSPDAFRRNVRILESKHNLPRHAAVPFAYSVLMWACERSATAARGDMSKMNEDCSSGACKVPPMELLEFKECAEAFMSPPEKENAKTYKRYLMEAGNMDTALENINWINSILSKEKPKKLQEAENEKEVAKLVIDELENEVDGLIVDALSRVLRAMGYDDWPDKPEDQKKVDAVIDVLQEKLKDIGRRFQQELRPRLREIMRLGPEAYSRRIKTQVIMRKPELKEPVAEPEGEKTGAEKAGAAKAVAESKRK